MALRNYAILSITVMFAVLGCNSAMARPAPLTAHQVGEYAGMAWGDPAVPPVPGSWQDRKNLLRYTIRSVNFRSTETPDLSGVRQEILWGQGYNPKRTMLVRLDFWDGADRYSLPMRDISVYKARLDWGCQQLQPVMNLIHGISLSEENVPYDGHIAVLEELYWHVKAQYPNLPVYQWWSPNTAIPTTYDGTYLPADGWIIDVYTLCPEMYPNTLNWTYNDDGAPYHPGPDPYLKLLQKYVITGTPVLSMLAAASESFGEWYDITTTPYPPAIMWDIVEHQRNINLAFNVSTNYYWTYVNGYFPMVTGEPLQDAITQDVRAHCWEMIYLDPAWTGDPAIADHWDNTPVAISFGGSTYFEDHFTNPKLVDYSSGSGFRDLILNGQDLRVRGFNGRAVDVEIRYNYISGSTMIYPRITLQADIDSALNGQVRLSASADGQNWPLSVETQPTSGLQNVTLPTGTEQEFAAINSFWLKIEITADAGTFDDPPVRIDDLMVCEGTEVVGCGNWGYLVSDLNRNCHVDLEDMAILMSRWLQCTDPSRPSECSHADN